VGECVRDANALVFDRMNQNETHRGMGATVAGLRIAPEGIIGFNVGDARIYRMQDGYLSQLSVDDVPVMPRSGAGRTGLITQSLGGVSHFTDIRPHVFTQPRPVTGDRTYLLCSDGLYDGLELEELESAIDDDLGASVSRLFERAMAAGAFDNISIVLLSLKSRP
jgi:protein phosphatase